MMQSVHENIMMNGVPIQWSADITEHAHIDVVKKPARAGNNRNHEVQICLTLDRIHKARQFDLATSMRELENRREEPSFQDEFEDGRNMQGSGWEDDGDEHDDTSALDNTVRVPS